MPNNNPSVYAIIDRDFISSYTISDEHDLSEAMRDINKRFQLFDSNAQCVGIRDNIYFIKTIIFPEAIKTFKGIEHVAKIDDLVREI